MDDTERERRFTEQREKVLREHPELKDKIPVSLDERDEIAIAGVHTMRRSRGQLDDSMAKVLAANDSGFVAGHGAPNHAKPTPRWKVTARRWRDRWRIRRAMKRADADGASVLDPSTRAYLKPTKGKEPPLPQPSADERTKRNTQRAGEIVDETGV